jgi:hypothetical protein
MTTEVKEYNHSEIVEWLEKKIKSEEIKTYQDLEESSEFQDDVEKAIKEQQFFIYPRLCIDLIQVEKKPEPIDEEKTEKTNGERKELFNYYTLFFVVSSETIFKDRMDDLKRRLSFYQFYLSRISEPKRLEIVVVVPHYVNLPKESLKFFQEYGFGLWKINIEKDEKEDVVAAEYLRDRMIKEFKVSVDNPENLGETVEWIFGKKELKDIATFKGVLKEKESAEGFVLFFEQYVLAAVDAIAGVTPDKFGRRYIDRKLLNLMFKLDRVSYGKRLRELVNEHLDENLDDYEFVSEVFSTLWEEDIGIPYSRFLSIFEPALLHVFAEGEKEGDKFYRDHYIHQFQVFLLGLYIIDKLYDYFAKKCKNPEISWLIASSFHDMAYPVQLYDDWSMRFFKDVFNVPIELAHIELRSNFVDQSFLSCMGYLICSLYASHKGEIVKGNWIADKNELVQFFYHAITKGKNHCILSSMSLLKMVQVTSFDEKNTIRKKISNDQAKFDDILKDVFVPSALAIALHDKGVWQRLRKESLEDDPPKILDNLEFEKDPLSFLLVFCDNIQEWGRPSKSGAKKEGEREMKFRLQNIEGNSETGLDITIWTPKHKKSEQFFVDKQNELRTIQFFLKQPADVNFTVHLKDKNGDGEDFTMQGSSSPSS